MRTCMSHRNAYNLQEQSWNRQVLYVAVVRWIYNGRGECWVSIKAIGAQIRVKTGVKRGAMGGQQTRLA